MELQDQVQLLLKSRNYFKLTNQEMKGAILAYGQGESPTFTSNTVFARNVDHGTTIYEEPHTADFLIINKDVFPNKLIIQCIDLDNYIQSDKGPDNMKKQFPYLLLNIKKNITPSILIYIPISKLDRPATNWLSAQVAEANSCLNGVYTLNEFTHEVSKGFLENKA